MQSPHHVANGQRVGTDAGAPHVRWLTEEATSRGKEQGRPVSGRRLGWERAAGDVCEEVLPGSGRAGG